MKLLSWNCCGLARLAATRALRTVIKEMDLGGIFFIETKVGSAVSCVVKKVGFSCFIEISPVGKDGGFVFRLRPSLSFDIVWESTHILHLRFHSVREYH